MIFEKSKLLMGLITLTVRGCPLTVYVIGPQETNTRLMLQKEADKAVTGITI